ncbi:MAG: DUF4476 domain-containing protein [Rhodobacterales bacterium]|nr:DUF4476 domain-containing protein [Rhodobacterales bacterium]
MFWWLLASLASAGTVYIDCDTPVLAKIDGDLVRKDPTTRIIIPDLTEGDYRVEITNLLGVTQAFVDVTIGWDNDLYFEYTDTHLDIVVEEQELFLNGDNRPVVSDTNFGKMKRKLMKGSLKKKLKTLEKYTSDHAVTMRQVDSLLSAFHSREDRLAALYYLVDHCNELDKYSALNRHFAVDSDREKMHNLFEAALSQQ